ncbi:MAG: nitroreductase family protein [Desulfovibrionaceae bacterium]|nr:nitroreductase family protein [Desulfovibrionaceae bacterium]MBF0515301.1 nitroreductase family protein [Desulfovibrionaceae bacterium]
MDFIKVDDAACKRDGMCADVCPTGCIELDAEGLPRQTKGAMCIACGHCVAVCPHEALGNSNLDAAGMLPLPESLPDAASVRGLMLSRRSVRVYKDTPVPAATLAGLLDTARHAPTAVNTQNVAYAACADPAKTREAARLCIEWLRGAGVYPHMVAAWDKGRDAALRGAPAIVVAHCPADYAWGETDCVIAVSYLELFAAASGLGTCWAGLLTRAAQASADLARLLAIPEGSVARAALMIGYPKYRYRAVPSRRAAKVTWL